MAELLRNAWTGWLRVTGGGKVMALFLAALLCLWVGYKQEKQRLFLEYCTISALCCIVPVTAGALMLYQTGFYDYEWIWSIVPVTVVTAYAGTRVLSEYWQGFRREAWRKGLPVTAGLLAAALLCCVPGGTGVDRTGERDWREQTEAVLEVLRTETESILKGAGTEDSALCMWAPAKIMEYSRRLDSSIILPYGRNMWEAALGAYSYDTCSAEAEKMYQWMCTVEETCTENNLDKTDMLLEKMAEQELSTRECLAAARQAGVNILILPADMNQVVLNEVTEFVNNAPERNAGYYFFLL